MRRGDAIRCWSCHRRARRFCSRLLRSAVLTTTCCSQRLPRVLFCFARCWCCFGRCRGHRCQSRCHRLWRTSSASLARGYCCCGFLKKNVESPTPQTHERGERGKTRSWMQGEKRVTLCHTRCTRMHRWYQVGSGTTRDTLGVGVVGCRRGCAGAVAYDRRRCVFFVRRCFPSLSCISETDFSQATTLLDTGHPYNSCRPAPCHPLPTLVSLPTYSSFCASHLPSDS